MTMRIRITNFDEGRRVKVTEETFEPGSSQPVSTYARDIGPGGMEEFYIHASKTLRVVEVPE